MTSIYQKELKEAESSAGEKRGNKKHEIMSKKDGRGRERERKIILQGQDFENSGKGGHSVVTDVYVKGKREREEEEKMRTRANHRGIENARR